MLTLAKTKEIGNKLNVNFDVISVNTLRQGIIIELEHGKRYKETNITNDNLILTAKIALAHLIEYPDYYDYLEKMEEKLYKKWSGKKKPNIFLKK